ncbi:3-hydroxyacyl-ACP dehydratase FabZ family protein [Brevibacillus fulvus]|uniref:3-hydroxyacyl-[acyl-carrier-protein] dehydratase n=1 Tax=Brevibacillus fulvus TaxID=1125967 RepID=A0A939BTP5_9BACL|nr:FabA-like domain protein [Brevibacillus fulvus]MBM7589684.1 3-hydroxyacyl-[acyl-carrier-protein] dehydratase [Brevibacillus fulvus]
MSLDELLTLLPQQYPFRFVDEVTRYVPGSLLEAKFLPAPLRQCYGNGRYFPETCMLEGLAQATVILTQLETEPLKQKELPLLGSIEASLIRPADWDEQLTYVIKPVRIAQKRAIFDGTLVDSTGQQIALAMIGVAIAYQT